ncbi:MAG: hypothetical protein RSC76_07965 [Oscillospiraceae bacterium]
MNIFLIAVLSFLSVIGMVDLLRKLIFWAYRPFCERIYMGVSLRNIEEAENTIRSLLQRIRWMEFGVPVRLILVDRSGDPEVKRVAQKLISEFPEVTLLSAENMDYNRSQ